MFTQAAWTKAPYEVCGASFTSQAHELALFARSIPLTEEESGELDLQDHVSIFVVCLRTGKLKTPRMDVAIQEDGKPPAFALSKTVPVLGSDYLYIGLGCNHVGVFSLATGEMVKDIELDLPQYSVILELNLVGGDDSDSRDLLCCLCDSPSDKSGLFFFQVEEGAALDEALGSHRKHLEVAPPMEQVLILMVHVPETNVF